MWFSKIHARAFGPMKNHGLEFKKGLNIVHGPNESGKSSWHTAITAALCGLRRGTGRTKAEREFEERYRPWDAGEDDPWFVQAGVMLDDGRHIEIDRDFDNRKTDVRRADLGGRAFTDLPMNDGSPDGSMLLGLDRETFPMTASVGQASIISDLDEPDALQQHLARAAAGGAGGTAAGALEKLDEYKRDHVGLDRKNSTKPLRTAKNAASEAEASLEAAESAHREYLDLVSALQQHRRKVKRLTSEKAQVEAQRSLHVAKQKVERLNEAVNKLDKWEKRFSDGDPSHGELPDLPELAQALGRVKSLPQSEATHLDSVEVLEARLSEVDCPDSVPCLLLEDVERCVGQFQDSDPHVDAKSVTPVGLVAVVGLVAAGVVGVAIGLAYGVALAVLVLAASWAMSRRVRRVRSAANRRVQREARSEALRQLDEWQLPHDPVAAVSEVSRRIQARVSRTLLAQQIEQRTAFDSREVQRRESHEDAWGKLQSLASTHGVKGDDHDLRARIEETLRRHSAIQEQRDKEVEEWGRYQEALDGRTLQDWRHEADRARTAEGEALRVLSALGAEPVDKSIGIDRLDSEIRCIGEQLEVAGRQASERQGALSRVDPAGVDVASAEARLSEAEAELERVEHLAITLDSTRKLLEQAAENAHQLLAPSLAAQMSPWVPKVTNGRYKEVQVDPGNLSVTLVTAAGHRRDARLVSRGTTEQTYLVLRLVLAQVLSAGHETCPVLLDDPTVHADADRKQEVLDYLLAASKEHQVIVFSQEQEVLDWVRKQPAGAVRLIELADPQPA